MKRGYMGKLRNIFMYITLIWSAVMLTVYLVILFKVPIFTLISYLPLGEALCNFLTFVLLLGIWVVPALYIITILLAIFARSKLKDAGQNKKLFVTVILLPLCLMGLMFATHFLERLA